MTIGRRCGVKVDSAMISDVPGYTWGIVPALAQAGVKYFSIGPNWNDRIGRTMITWEDKPFYWLAPDRQHKVLCWVPYLGYAFGHMHKVRHGESAAGAPGRNWKRAAIPTTWSICAGTWAATTVRPMPTISDVVKNWNAKHAYPKLVIATTSRVVPRVRETLRRQDSGGPRRFHALLGGRGGLVGAGNGHQSHGRRAARAGRDPLGHAAGRDQYPAAEFSDAWRNVILYDEHTWGAYNSITEPDKPFVKDQWKIKQAFALDGDAQSRKLLTAVLAAHARRPNGWRRGRLEHVGLAADRSGRARQGTERGRRRCHRARRHGPSPRSGFRRANWPSWPKTLPGLAGRRYTIGAGKAPAMGGAKAEANTLSSAGRFGSRSIRPRGPS